MSSPDESERIFLCNWSHALQTKALERKNRCIIITNDEDIVNGHTVIQGRSLDASQAE
jgi:hypothetical protein